MRDMLHGNGSQIEMKDRPVEPAATAAATNEKTSIIGSKSSTVFYLVLSNLVKREIVKLSVCAVYWSVL